MATSTIKYANYKSGTVTNVDGTTATNLYIRQYGRVVVINGYISATLTANTESTIANFSGVSTPSATVRTLCGVGSNAYSHPTDVAFLAIGQSGKISVTSTQSGSKTIFFTASYIS